jgi:hypothetical protein
MSEQTVRNGGDLIGLATWGAWFAGIIPAIGLALTAIWTYFRIIEMITGEPFHKSRQGAWLRAKLGKCFKRNDEEKTHAGNS